MVLSLETMAVNDASKDTHTDRLADER